MLEHPGARAKEAKSLTDPSLARPPRAVTTKDNAEQLYLYPHPLTLARNRAEAERARLADTAAYSAMCATWGHLGGLSTLYAYGPAYFRLLALRRWGKATTDDLASARSDARTRACSGCRGRFVGRDLIEVGDDHLAFFEGDELCRSCARDHGVPW